MAKRFMKGYEAVAETAVRAGCRFYAGYPITPQNQIPEYLCWRLPEVGGSFVQAESEVSAINMVYGSAASGTRSLISSASCGISLMSETISWIAGAELPVVIMNFQRGGPGIGDIGPTQMDYAQATKAHGNGAFKMIVMAPATLQETVDMLYGAFDIAEQYRTPVYFLMDGISAGLMESVELPEMLDDSVVASKKEALRSDWVLTGNDFHEGIRLVSAYADSGAPLQKKNVHLAEKYREWEQTQIAYENYLTDDAEIVLTAYGISARFVRSAIEVLRADGIKAGMVRPINVYPFPNEAYDKLDYSKLKGMLSVEMSIPELFVDDVRAAVAGRTKVETYATSGGVILDTNEIIRKAREICTKEAL